MLTSYFAVMSSKQIFPFRIRDNAYEEMRKILRFPEVTAPEINGKICRVTVTDYPTDLSLKREYCEHYKNDHVFQVRLLENSEREFIVMASMLEHIPEPVVVS